jgi:cobalt-zinc-cadmium efflux system membrane fusion protein
MSRNNRSRTFSPLMQVVIVVALFVLAGLALLWFSRAVRGAPVALVQGAPEAIPSGFFKPTDQQWQGFKIAAVTQMGFPDVSESEGTIAPADDATTQVFAPFTGRVTRVFVTTGDVVHQGVPLFSGEGNEYAQAQNDVTTAQQTLDAARIQLRVTETNRARLLKLLRVDGAAQKDVEQSLADVANARLTVRNAETAAALARSHLEVLGENLGSGSALQEAGQQTLRTGVVVRAPIGGVITQRALGAGQYVESAADGATTPLLTISDLSRVFLVADTTESQIAHIRAGDRVAVRMAAFPDRIFEGRVKYIAPAVDPNTHRIAVRAEVANPDGALKLGMFGSFRISAGSSLRAIAVPEEAVIFEGETARVWITGPKRTLALRYIRAGKTVNGMVEVLSGLRPGDHIVTSGSLFIDRASQGNS